MERLEVTPAVQNRSQRTMAKIETAFEQLLQQQGFEDIAVAEVCSRAGCSVGTFYGRFSSKDALLAHLRRRLYAQMQSELSELLAFGPDESTEHAIHRQIAALVKLHRERRGLLRAAVLQARRDAQTAASTRAFNAELMGGFISAWLLRKTDFTVSDPEAAVRHVFFLTNGALRERILFDELWPINDQDSAFAKKMAATACRELGVTQ